MPALNELLSKLGIGSRGDIVLPSPNPSPSVNVGPSTNPYENVKQALPKATSIGPGPHNNELEFWRNHPFLDSAIGFVAGVNPSQFASGDMGPTDILNVASPLGHLARAGLPFAAIRGGQPVYHGTQRLFDKFDYSKNDVNDVLGWMAHFAENPEYSNTYAMGQTKGLKHFSPYEDSPITKQDLTIEPSWWNDDRNIEHINPHLLVAKPEAQNVLDLVDPNADDISQTLAAMDPERRQDVIQQFKNARRSVRTGSARNLLDRTHYPNLTDIPTSEIPVRALADRLRLTSEEFANTPFDAIRYRDNAEKAWAIPEGTPIKSAYGAPLTETPKPIKVIKRAESVDPTATLIVNSPNLGGQKIIRTPAESKWDADAPVSDYTGWQITSPWSNGKQDFMDYMGHNQEDAKNLFQNIQSSPSAWEGYKLHPPESPQSTLDIPPGPNIGLDWDGKPHDYSNVQGFKVTDPLSNSINEDFEQWHKKNGFVSSPDELKGVIESKQWLDVTLHPPESTPTVTNPINPTGPTDYTGWQIKHPNTEKPLDFTNWVNSLNLKSSPDDYAKWFKNHPDIWEGYKLIPPTK